MLACLASFFARTKIPAFLLSRSSDTTPTNLLFYGHIADLTGADLLKQTAAAAEYNGSPDKYLQDLAAQVVINSKIARQKFVLFNVALWITTAAVATPLVAIIFYWKLCATFAMPSMRRAAI